MSSAQWDLPVQSARLLLQSASFFMNIMCYTSWIRPSRSSPLTVTTGERSACQGLAVNTLGNLDKHGLRCRFFNRINGNEKELSESIATLISGNA